MKKLIIIPVLLAAMMSCSESERFHSTSNDSTPPAPPVFISSTPLAGGATIRFNAPEEPDLLGIEATYTNEAGRILTFASSAFKDSVDVYGFGKAGQHQISLNSIDIAGNRSEAIPVTVEVLEPPAETVAKSLGILSSFSSIILKWENRAAKNVYVCADLEYGQNGKKQAGTVIFDSNMTEERIIDNLVDIDNAQVKINVSVRDKFDNIFPAKDTALVILSDRELDKKNFSLPAASTVICGEVQANGSVNLGRETYLLDGIIESVERFNFWRTDAPAPWNIIIDLGGYYELSRIRTWQVYSSFASADSGTRGSYYRAENVLRFRTFYLDETTQTWVMTGDHSTEVPVVEDDKGYVLLGDAGDEHFLYPEEPHFTPKTRFFMFQAQQGAYISELSLYGK